MVSLEAAVALVMAVPFLAVRELSSDPSKRSAETRHTADGGIALVATTTSWCSVACRAARSRYRPGPTLSSSPVLTSRVSAPVWILSFAQMPVLVASTQQCAAADREESALSITARSRRDEVSTWIRHS